VKIENEDELRRIYADTKTIAVVGASSDPSKPGNRIPRYLQSQGYRIVPISPKGGEILGEPAFSSLADVEGSIDVVDVFRPPDEAEDVASAAISADAKILCFQLGTHTDEAVELARDAGLTVVYGRCMGVTHGALGLGPGPDPA